METLIVSPKTKEQLTAIMIANEITQIATFNQKDFINIIEIRLMEL